MLFQRTPLVQMLLPEANLLGSSHVLNASAVMIATVAGLGAYDTVSGATSVAQVSPSAGSATVAATSGTNLVLLVQVVGAGGHTPASWTVTGTLPTGLTHANAKKSKTDSISGVPTQSGSFPITIKAWEDSNASGRSATGTFTITVTAPPSLTFTTQPSSVTIVSGNTATMSVVVSGSIGINYQWYRGNVGITTTPVGLNSPAFTTPALTADTNYWVKATSSTVPAGQNSLLATVTVLQPASITTPPQNVTIEYGTTAVLSVAAAGTAPFTYQWYQGAAGVISTPVGGNSPSYTTQNLNADASYWVKVSNGALPQGTASSVALVTVNPVVLPTYVEWVAATFSVDQQADSAISGAAADPDGDGLINEYERLFGTPPLSFQNSLLAIANSAGSLHLSFMARSTVAGSDHIAHRYYAVEQCTDLQSNAWQSMPSFGRILGNDTQVTVPILTNNPKSFYRLRAWLEL